MTFTVSHTNANRIFWGLSLLLAICVISFFLLKETSFVYIPFAILAVLFVLFYDIKVLFFLLLFFIPFSVEYAVTDTLSTDLPDEPMMVGLAGCIILYILYDPSTIKKYIKHPLIQLLFLELTWIFITIFFAYEKEVSIKFLLAKSWYVLSFVFGTILLVRTKKDFALLALCYVVPMLVITVWTLYNHSFAGFSFAEANHVMHPFFRNHVNYSSLLVCVVPMLYLIRKFTPGLNKKLWKWVTVIILIGLLFSYARGAWLALIVGLATFYIVKKNQLKKILQLATLVVLLGVALLSVNDNYLKFAPDHDQTIFHKDFGEHIVATYTLRDVSNAERFYRWIAGVRMSMHQPLTGYGPNNFYANYKRFADPRFRTWVSNNADHSSVHNYFLLLMIEQGIPGMIIFYLLLFYMFLYAQNLYHRIKDEFYKEVSLSIAVILSMIITVIMLSDLIETDKIGGLFYVCLGLLVTIDYKTRDEDKGIIPA
ncbi:MAG: O-antigen ligase family protein [Sphingobacteriales bacterium]|nr:MAG: O-antigen ligase family protein [Sphingobacteriales bacterium]